MYRKTILALALFAVILSWSASNAKLFIDEAELEELEQDLELAEAKTTTKKAGAKSKTTTTKTTESKTTKKTSSSKGKTGSKSGGKAGDKKKGEKGGDEKKGEKGGDKTKSKAETKVTTKGKPSKVSGGVAWWVWVLIVVAILGVIVAVYKYGVKKGENDYDAC